MAEQLKQSVKHLVVKLEHISTDELPIVLQQYVDAVRDMELSLVCVNMKITTLIHNSLKSLTRRASRRATVSRCQCVLPIGRP